MYGLRLICRPSSFVAPRRVGLAAFKGPQHQFSFRPRPHLVLTWSRHASMAASTTTNHGDLNNTEVLRKTVALPPDPAYARTTLAIPQDKDDEAIRSVYRSFLLPKDVAANDWVSKLELSTVLKMSEADMESTGGDRLKVMVLYGSLRNRCVVFDSIVICMLTTSQLVLSLARFRMCTHTIPLGLRCSSVQP
jgi:hypothetical protein